MSNIKPVIEFIGYRVANIQYTCNPAFEFPDQNISFNFNFNKSFARLSSSEIQENIAVNVFFGSENDISNTPYKLAVEIAGRFTCNAEWQPQWEANAMAILFPYLRAIVSTVTSSSGREPIILPTINIASLFKNDLSNRDLDDRGSMGPGPGNKE